MAPVAWDVFDINLSEAQDEGLVRVGECITVFGIIEFCTSIAVSADSRFVRKVFGVGLVAEFVANHTPLAFLTGGRHVD